MKLLPKVCALAAAVGLYATAFSAPDTSGDASRAGLVEQANKLAGQSRSDVRTVLHLRELARKQKDSVKFNCVNEALVQIKPHMNLLEDGAASLPTATDPTGTFGSVQKSADSVRQLTEQAQQCLGEPDLGGESENSVTYPKFPDDPFQDTNPWEDTRIEDPGYASPYS